ncbi:MAG: hypothetical protein IJY46_07735 [Lentisphaeria bacterium]|nr:hypothetical protein [Lentisphaeria bacterium]
MLERNENTLLFEVSQTPVFDFNIRFFDKSDIKLFLEQDGGGSLSLIPGTDYSVEDKDDYSDGAKITLNIGSRNLPQLPSGKKLAISRILPLHQTLNLPENGKIPSTGLELQLDRIVMQIQQLSEKLGRTIAAPPTSGTPTYTPGIDPDPGTDPDPGDDPGTDPDPTVDLYNKLLAGLAALDATKEWVVYYAALAEYWAGEAAASGGAPAYHLTYDVYGETQIVYPTIIDPGDTPIESPVVQPIGSKVTWTKVDMNGKPVYGDDHTTVESVRVIPGEVLSEGIPTTFTI